MSVNEVEYFCVTQHLYGSIRNFIIVFICRWTTIPNCSSVLKSCFPSWFFLLGHHIIIYVRVGLAQAHHNYCIYCIYLHHSTDPLLLLILHIQNNKSVKAPFTSDVRNKTVFGVGSHAKYSFWLWLMMYLPLDPTPHTVFSVHHL